MIDRLGQTSGQLRHPEGTPQWRALERAVRLGIRLRIEPRRRTVTTMQGITETGWIVYGRAHGGGDLGIVFPSEQEAQDHIDAINQVAREALCPISTSMP
jgi:hypothetical protein